MIHLHTLLAQAQTLQAVEDARETVSNEFSFWRVLLMILAYLILPFLIGEGLARLLKLRDLGTRIGVVLFVLALGLSPFINTYARQGNLNDVFRLGVDLAGGMNLVFEVDVEKAESLNKDVNAEVMDQMVGAISRRINPSGTEETTVRRVGSYKIEVIVPDVDPEQVQVIKDRIMKLGSLEFAILAHPQKDSQVVAEARELGPNELNLFVGQGAERRLRAAWKPVGRDRDGEFKTVEEEGAVTRVVPRTIEVDGKMQTRNVKEFLVIFEPDNRRVTGEFLVRASAGADQQGKLAVDFFFNQQGGYRFQALTSKYRPDKEGQKRRLSILLDDQIHSAPSILTTINQQGQITGDFDREEIDELVNVLNAGALQVPLKGSPRQNIVDPTLGASVQESGTRAIGIAGIAVVLFMFIYYRAAGVIANLCLVLNVILVLGTMAFISATFTLPGLAGIVLTIGMAVDANVLIFERIREELHRGSSLRMAIQNGFDRAFSAIIDSNLTTLITAVVLYVIGTDQVKGFAVTLFIGIVMSMFTALYFGRLVFDILERKRWVKGLNMMSLVSEHSKFDFLGKKKIALTFSSLLIVVGLVSLVARGRDNLDIDFAGGAMVSFEFMEDQNLEAVRDQLETKFGPGITLERLRAATDQKGVSRFRLRTRESDPVEVQQNVFEAFEGSDMHLRHVSMEIGDIEPIFAAAPQPEEGEEQPATQQVRGHQVRISFKTQKEGGGTVPEDIPQPSASSYLVTALSNLKDENGEPKFGSKEAASALVDVEGVEETEDEKGQVLSKQYHTFLVQTKPELSKEDLEAALGAVKQKLDQEPFFSEVDTFDSSAASEMQGQAIMALLVSMLAIIGYIWFRFQRITFGIAAAAALVHDVLIVLGMVALGSYLANTPLKSVLALEDFKINLPMIAAFLTVVGYSLNDTIVIFDRIREIRGKNPALTQEMVNRSLNQTLSRTLLTSLTTLIVVAILYFGGGEGIHGFAYCLLVGIIIGTYSSIYIASPVLIWLMNRPGVAPVRSTVGTTAKPSV